MGAASENIRSEAIANTYFRIGQQAVLIAHNRRESLVRQITAKYKNGIVNSLSDFQILSNPLVVIDDDRIFDVVRELNNGSVLGLDTNQWSGEYGKRNAHSWTTLTK